MSDHPLKVTSPRLEQDVFHLTPVGRDDRPDARRLDQNLSSSRAVYDGDPFEDPPAETALTEFGGDA